MNPTGGMTTGLSPDAFQTAIDGFIKAEYNRKPLANMLEARDSFFFKQSRMDGIAHIWDEWSNVGSFDEMGEQETLIDTNTLLGNTKTKRATKWTKQIPISAEAFKADKVGLRAEIGRNIGDRALLSQDKNAIFNTYADLIAGSINTTPDGQAPASNSHVTLGAGGVTVDNLETGSLNADNLWTVIQSLMNQKAQDGELGGHRFAGLVVPLILHRTAHEVLDSQLVPFSGENQVNVFNTIYGSGVRVSQSQFLGSTYNTAANANTSYHVLSDNHHIERKVFMDLENSLIRPEWTSNDSWAERAKFMEAHFPATWEGFVSSNGTA